MDRYEQARQAAIQGLKNALAAHERGERLSIGAGFEEFDHLLPREELPPTSILWFAYELWSGWSDTAAHEWQYYEPLTKNDWPRLGAILLDNLEANAEVTNAEIRQHFSLRPPKSLVRTVLGWFRAKKI